MSTEGINIVGVQFRRSGKIYDFSSNGIEVIVGDQVIVDSERGPSLAEVVSIRFHHPNETTKKKLKSIVRVASKKELSRPSRLTPEKVTEFTKEKVKERKLNMKVLKSEVQFGGNKVMVYFTAPGRVNFRELVRDLAGGLKTRIELKQIGARDETKLLGGMGICGREYCCSSFLREFVPVSIRMAKNQNLALNPNKVSGGCGRLLCCLTYENEAYSSLRLNLPPIGAKVRLLDYEMQVGTVVRSDLLNQTAIVTTQDAGDYEVKLEKLDLVNKTNNSYQDNGSDSYKIDPIDQEATQWADDLDFDKLMESAVEHKNKNLNRDQFSKSSSHKHYKSSSQKDHRIKESRDGDSFKEQDNSKAKFSSRVGRSNEPQMKTTTGSKNHNQRHQGHIKSEEGNKSKLKDSNKNFHKKGKKRNKKKPKPQHEN